MVPVVIENVDADRDPFRTRQALAGFGEALGRRQIDCREIMDFFRGFTAYDKLRGGLSRGGGRNYQNGPKQTRNMETFHHFLIFQCWAHLLLRAARYRACIISAFGLSASCFARSRSCRIASSLITGRFPHRCEALFGLEDFAIRSVLSVYSYSFNFCVFYCGSPDAAPNRGPSVGPGSPMQTESRQTSRASPGCIFETSRPGSCSPCYARYQSFPRQSKRSRYGRNVQW